jgi:hypothetical protein
MPFMVYTIWYVTIKDSMIVLKNVLCTVCNLKCERYHLLKCKDRILSLKQYALLDKDNLWSILNMYSIFSM